MCGGGWRRWRGHDQAQRPFLHPGCGRVVIRVIVLGEVDDVDARHSRAAKAVRGSVEKKRERERDNAFQPRKTWALQSFLRQSERVSEKTRKPFGRRDL